MTEPTGMGDVIATQIRRYRLLRNWSVRQLAEECERLGAPQLTASSLANIERGQAEDAKRTGRQVLVEELAVLARALDVPPVLLTLPLGRQAVVQILPNHAVDTWSAVKWWIGDIGFEDGNGDGTALIGYFRDHDELVNTVRHNRERRTGDLATSWERSLRDLRKNMRRAGVLPPELPADLADIEEQEGSKDG